MRIDTKTGQIDFGRCDPEKTKESEVNNT